MKRFSRVLVAAADSVPSALMGAIVLVILADVTGRYLFHSPIRGAAEIATMSLIGLVYIGAITVMRDGQHIAVDVLRVNVPTRVAAVLDIVVNVIIIATLATTLVAAWPYFMNTKFTSFSLTGVSRQVFVGVLILSLTLMAIYALIAAVSAAKGARSGEYTVVEHTIGMSEDQGRTGEKRLP